MGKCSRQITPMLKSLLRHRQNQIHFHMIVDAASQHTTSKLFDTWDLPDGININKHAYYALLTFTHSTLIHFKHYCYSVTTMFVMQIINFVPVKYTCYNAQSRLSQVRWIPNSHYSGIYALVKLLLPDILPASLTQVIVLDSDLTFLCDIAELWMVFRNMTRNQVSMLIWKHAHSSFPLPFKSTAVQWQYNINYGVLNW